MTTAITFWGTGDSAGVPRVFCECAICTEARDTGVNRRYRSLVHVDDPEFGSMLIDCGPDWRGQMERAGKRRIERILITHAHFDHIGGLPEWADMCRYLGIKGEAYAMPDVIGDIGVRFPWIHNQIAFIPIEGPLQFGGWTVGCWRVNHGKNGHAYAFRFSHNPSGRSWAYCSDAIALTDEQQQPLHGLNVLILGTNFYKEPFAVETRSVYDVVEALDCLQIWKPDRAIFTHLSHDIDLRRSYPLPPAVEFARTGTVISV
ncbi:MBL fold metallo-hydrolase [Paenibacillus oenotherae]|uniref:MBL fold metallo-hydrolase n=1 Tax=Paenibacillus oenotherae TaxID=1435645 RepID=A0ABS7DCC2_9BACL|nr:MBL fold metallo-hydrolase [Paenibacillus oenotherae]MBW7477590.1 MBL fold metallo-hydrolase [Paenibacillus oenotherae]